MAKRVSKKAQVEVVAQAPVEVAPAPVPVEVKKVKEPESAETKWARRLKRWSLKVEAEGVDPVKLMKELMAA